MADYAKHEAVADVVILEATGIFLPDVAEIACPQSDALQAEVQSQQLPEAERIARMSTEDVVPHSTLRNLPVTLAKLRTEHQANHGQICLITYLHGQFPQPKRISSTGRERKVHAELPLRRIVAVSVIIEETKVCAYHCTAFQVKIATG